MRNRLFLILTTILASVLTPNLTVADGEIVVRGVDTSYDVKTVIPVVETFDNPAVKMTSRPAVAAKITTATKTPTVVAHQTMADSITIFGHTINITSVESTTINAGDHVNRYGDRFLYGHNTSRVFGPLKNLNIGDAFAATVNGSADTYEVAKIVIYEKNDGKLQLDGKGSYMGAVAKARSEGISYDLSIMTCSGVSYGNGDASHRLVIFANKI